MTRRRRQVPKQNRGAEKGGPPPEAAADWIEQQNAIIGQLLETHQFNRALDVGLKTLRAIESQFGEQAPFSRVHDFLAAAYQGIGNFDKAIHHLKQALFIRRAVLAPNDANIALTLDNLASIAQSRGDYADAISWRSEAVGSWQATEGVRGAHVAQELVWLGDLLFVSGQLQLARRSYLQAFSSLGLGVGSHSCILAAITSHLGIIHRRLNNVCKAKMMLRLAVRYVDLCDKEDRDERLSEVADTYYELGDLDAAKRITVLRLSALEDPMRLNDPLGIEIGDMLGVLNCRLLGIAPEPLPSGFGIGSRAWLDDQASTIARLIKVKRLREAVKASDRTLTIIEAELGHRRRERARFDESLAGLLAQIGDWDRAVAHQAIVVEIKRNILGEDHPYTATALANLSEFMLGSGNAAAAIAPRREAVNIWWRLLGSRSRFVAAELVLLGRLFCSAGDLQGARRCLVEAVTVHRRRRPEISPEMTKALSRLGKLEAQLGRKAAALMILRAALRGISSIKEDLTDRLSEISDAYVKIGDLDAAISTREMQVQALMRGPTDHTVLALALNALGALHQEAGHSAAAIPILIASLRQLNRHKPKDLRLEASIRINLGVAAAEIGDKLMALQQLKLGLPVLRAAGENEVESLLSALVLYAKILGDLAQKQQTEAILSEALEIAGAHFGLYDTRYADLLDNLGSIHDAQGEPAHAVPLIEEAIAIRSRVLGPRHHLVAVARNNLGSALASLGDFPGAKEQLRQAIEITQQASNGNHPDLVIWRHNFALVQLQAGEPLAGIEMLSQNLGSADRIISGVLNQTSARQQIAFLESVRNQLWVIISVALRFGREVPGLMRLAMEAVLRRKGLAIEAQAIQHHAALEQISKDDGREHFAAIRLLSASIRNELLGLSQSRGGSPRDAAIEALQLQMEEIQRWFSMKSLALPDISHISVDEVAAALPKDAALLEIVQIRPLNWDELRRDKEYGPHRYVGFLLRAGRNSEVNMLDLGDAATLDDKIVLALAALRSGSGEQGLNLAELSNATIGPFLPHLKGTRHLVVCPDGEFNRVPFGALPLADDAPAIDRFLISYVASGRDILGWNSASVDSTAPMVVADPDFELGATKQRRFQGGGGRRGWPRPFERLRESKREGALVATALGPGAVTHEGSEALVSRVRTCRSPRILHLATHGFYLPPNIATAADADAIAERDRLQALARLARYDPLLRSGIALAGAQTWREGGHPPSEAEGGIMTAFDLAGLDLRGTELVCISSCESGLGDVELGEGMMGLRSALRVAGARTLVLSLWNINDSVAGDLMERFYKLLSPTCGPLEALQEAQRQQRRELPDAFYWGAFILVGDPGPCSASLEQIAI